MRLWLLVFLLVPMSGFGQGAPNPLASLRDIDYVGDGHARHTLDLYLPENKGGKPRPVVVFIHGGGWSAGSKDAANPLWGLLQETPFAGASINYRLTQHAPFPAQIHDCKAAIRWLRAHAKEHNLDPDKICAFGISAGGHLASLLGVTGRVNALEGELGKHLDQSSRVTCVMDFCGPSNFHTFDGKGSMIDVNEPGGVLAKLIGGPLRDKGDMARHASPVNYLTKDDAPFLIIHGEKDNIVPYAQATEFDAALDAANIPSILVTGTDGGHVFFSAPLYKRMRDFNDRHLLGKDVQIPEGAVPSK